MTGQAWNQGDRYKPVKGAQPLESILIEHSPYRSTYHLKDRLLKECMKDVNVAVTQSGWVNLLL